MKTLLVPFTEVKTHLSKYGRLAERGQTTVVLKHRRSAFMIVPPPQEEGQHRPKTPGLARGRIHMAADFDQTPEDVIAQFEGTA